MKYASLVLAACLALFTFSDAAPLIKSNSGKPIPDSYIVILKGGKNVTDFVTKFEALAVAQDGRGRKSTIDRHYPSLQGFSATINAAALKELLASDEVEYVEQDHIITLDVSLQPNPPSWGLPRISERKNRLNVPYLYQEQAGSGVTAYVIDTGIYVDHNGLKGRASMGANFIAGSPNTDENGHGTHVSGTIGDTKYGVAKKVKLVGVKVLNAEGSGAYSGVIAGMDWVIQHARGTKAVVNMSLGGPKSMAIDSAVNRLYAAGIPVIVSAGNEADVDSCTRSPAGTQGAFTVSASDIKDRVASFASWGSCVKIFAPGVEITSDWIGSPSAIRTISGTSMATPHVSGVVALFLSIDSSLTSPHHVYQKLLSVSTPGVVKGDLKGSPNRFLYNDA
ncbi:putative serine proteinase, precursor [Gamsiella multidivaricata]|uniref:putative serine proteinase, precursor n=1 Tax=Gamsiella multidivaricata TaxID=101098 RepID=UPI00221FA390|nr:putative serine proteinase, precursor [Gamsiella multidivaricata]KAG0360026.1 hypothetical protein BGZ54_009737 [Gamsiella multidivaricata]KAI7832435.1 putative serine proteinase, precursor [Gamsiella multidivaricata]